MADILLVDDDAEAVARNSSALEANGHTVVIASTTDAALEAVRKHAPDIAVLEAMLDGGLAGFDLARRLAHDLPNLPLIMLTRVDEHLTSKERASQDRDGGWLPVQRFLEKPVMPEVLVYEIDHLLPAGAGAHGGH